MRLLFFLFVQLIWIVPAFGQKPSLYVFVPSEIRPHAMRSILEEACPDLEISVFPRYREFSARMEQQPPDGILSLGPVVDAMLDVSKRPSAANYTKTLQGRKNDSNLENYVFLYEKNFDLGQINQSTLGVVDLLGRREMLLFLKQQLLLETNPRIKTVTKLEDLLSLIQFQYVDAILAPESKIDYYRTKSEIELKVKEIDFFKIALPTLATKKENEERTALIVKSLMGLPADVNSKLGVVTWSQQ